MRKYEKEFLENTIERVKNLQQMKFDKYIILNILDEDIEFLHAKGSSDLFINLFDLRQKVLLEKEIQ